MHVFLTVYVAIDVQFGQLHCVHSCIILARRDNVQVSTYDVRIARRSAHHAEIPELKFQIQIPHKGRAFCCFARQVHRYRRRSHCLIDYCRGEAASAYRKPQVYKWESIIEKNHPI